MFPQLTKDINPYHIYTLHNSRGVVMASSNNTKELYGILAWFKPYSQDAMIVRDNLNDTHYSAKEWFKNGY